ncbi:MAG: hypothetical protein ACXITR_09195 [Cyanobacterium sp.]
MNKNYRFSPILYFLLKLKSLKSSSKSGYVLVIAVGTIVALTGLLAVYGRSTRVNNIATSSTVDSSSGFFAAEAALNKRAQELRTLFLARRTPEGNSPQDLDECVGLDPGSEDENDHFECKTIELSASAANRTPYRGITYVVEGARNVDGVVPRGDRFQNLSMSESLFSIYALGLRENADASQASAILQMDVRAREIPMFQFAAFYKDDLEILPGPTMNLNGPIHTDGSLYLGANNTLNINGQVTVAGQLFSKRKNDNSTYANGRVRIRNAADSDWINLVQAGTGSTNATANAMDPVRIASAFGTQVQVGTEPVSIPTPDILDSRGQYFDRADIRIKFKPVGTQTGNMNYLKQIPFEITARNGGKINQGIVNLNSATYQRRLQSLRQPVMVGADLASIPTNSEFHICNPNAHNLSGTLANWWNGLTVAQKNNFREQAQNYVLEQIHGTNQDAPIPLSFLSLPLGAVNNQQQNLYGSFAQNTSSLNSALDEFTDSSEAIKKLEEMSAQQVAALNGRCFIAAPITDIGRDNNNHQSRYQFFNNREGRHKRLLQLNIESMVVWNRDGLYMATGNQLTPTDDFLFAKAPEDTTAPQHSFQRLGLAAADTTDGGMVIHAMVGDGVDNNGNPITYSNAYTNTSPYGFAIVRGEQLMGLARTENVDDPTGLTIATDQAIYPQGDYNTANYQPAGILADSFNPLSNACFFEDEAINRRNGANCNVLGENGGAINPTPTTFNAAVLAGTDITNAFGSGYNGGLENYPRFLENWGNRLWRYRGSFVSIARPLRVSGRWGLGNVYSAPERDWDYDENFNDPRNLPPLTPQFVYLKQDSFFRSFDQ